MGTVSTWLFSGNYDTTSQANHILNYVICLYRFSVSISSSYSLLAIETLDTLKIQAISAINSILKPRPAILLKTSITIRAGIRRLHAKKFASISSGLMLEIAGSPSCMRK